MKQLRLRGVVRLANRTRQELSRPIAPSRLSQLRAEIDKSLQTIASVLRQHGAGEVHLPSPTRKAYRFLQNIDWDTVRTAESAPTSEILPQSVSFPGLRRYLTAILHQLAAPPDEEDLPVVQKAIRQMNDKIEGYVARDHLRPEHLKDEPRATRGWLACFAQEERLNDYIAAIRLARPLFAQAIATSRRFRGKPLIHFRPMHGLYRLRQSNEEVLIQLPTPMITFPSSALKATAQHALGLHRSKKEILEAMTAPPYRNLLWELELLAGIVESSSGLHHDLLAAFERVNNAYFQNQMPQPRLTWSQTFTSRKLGHYDMVRDTIMVSSSLDDEKIPPFAVDFVLYHELLHKKLGVLWSQGRERVHTPAFTQEERRFVQFEEAQRILNNLDCEDQQR